MSVMHRRRRRRRIHDEVVHRKSVGALDLENCWVDIFGIEQGGTAQMELPTHAGRDCGVADGGAGRSRGFVFVPQEVAKRELRIEEVVWIVKVATIHFDNRVPNACVE